ncbi:DUF4870 domain-containing protein [Paenibacillus xylaniclasticus]|uniref:DUF4870 domain-containing protein n=1 Tax=Paenibacillus xylaniclasticus TaxID=588083 RepID=UPI000FD94049|nr:MULTISPECIES: DUF4870 domain-containing protein [Paenibacillus]GFN33220.1 hypothetical protein PCURB6_34800 [Paenibacillus curdlanolyticus]
MYPDHLSREDRLFGMLCHLLAFVGIFIPLGSVLGPLVIWLIKRDQSSYVDMQGKESLNFQISFIIYLIISTILISVVIGIITTIALLIIWVILTLIGTVKANDGSHYRYPFTIRFLK